METVYWSHFAEKSGGSLQNGAPQPPPGNGKEDHNILWLNMFSFTIFLWKWRNYKASLHHQAQSKSRIFPRCMLLVSQCANMLCDQHHACEGQHGGLLGRGGNWNFLKCIWANHCKHKYALTKWYIYWKDGFSTEWLADFSLSMTKNHTLKNVYKMAFCLLQNGWSWCPKMIMPSKQKL